MSIGFWQVVLILAIVLIIFGAGKLPTVMGDLAKGIKTFKAGMRDEMDEAKREAEAAAEPKRVEALPPEPAARKADETVRS
jgi:sec-independent protein translocase protein TatA